MSSLLLKMKHFFQDAMATLSNAITWSKHQHVFPSQVVTRNHDHLQVKQPDGNARLEYTPSRPTPQLRRHMP